MPYGFLKQMSFESPLVYKFPLYRFMTDLGYLTSGVFQSLEFAPGAVPNISPIVPANREGS
jgi:hypothetical protein